MISARDAFVTFMRKSFYLFSMSNASQHNIDFSSDLVIQRLDGMQKNNDSCNNLLLKIVVSALYT